MHHAELCIGPNVGLHAEALLKVSRRRRRITPFRFQQNVRLGNPDLLHLLGNRGHEAAPATARLHSLCELCLGMDRPHRAIIPNGFFQMHGRYPHKF